MYLCEVVNSTLNNKKDELKSIFMITANRFFDFCLFSN